ncbi:MAG TPA: VWA domain-containing protein [Blastocatellia bacterium]|nr:VWA domain-containing protein [Blastocatellia bacterium]
MRAKHSNSSRLIFSAISIFLLFTVCLSTAHTQSGKGMGSGRRTATLNVIVRAPEGKIVTKEHFDLYDDGIPQEIETFSRLDAGSRIVLMVDSSVSLKAEVAVLQKGMLALRNELYEDDQMMVVGFNESAEIIEDMTGDLASLQATPAKIIRKGFPNLFDALLAVSDSLAHQAKTGIEKRAIILISDGYDSESKTKFDEALRALQDENIVLYAIKTADRTRGALLRDKPKPPAALEKLTVGTGGAIFTFEKIEEAAKLISDDLRKNWYRLVYIPAGISTINDRRLLIMSREKDVELRTKGSHPGRYH